MQREFLQNIGVIPNVGQVRVRLQKRSLGSVEEFFMRMMKTGDVFVIDPMRYCVPGVASPPSS